MRKTHHTICNNHKKSGGREREREFMNEYNRYYTNVSNLKCFLLYNNFDDDDDVFVSVFVLSTLRAWEGCSLI